MTELVLEGECHNGQRPERLGDHHWRFEARGDNAHYCYYFHFTLRASEAEEAVVDIGPDSSLLPQCLASFRAHRPEAVWLSRGSGWERHPTAPDAPADHVRVRVRLEAGGSLAVSRMRPFPYSGVVSRVRELAQGREARAVLLGRTARGREIPALRIGSGAGCILALAGQHPAEFGGTEAVLGLADWLLSRVPEACEAREHFTFTVVPVLNPDGNVEGRNGYNARDEDLYRAFTDAAAGTAPAGPEAACLWEWVRRHQPLLTLNFHTYTQPSRTGNFPWEGLYTAPDEAFQSPDARERQRALDDVLAWETEGLSQSGSFARHVPGALEYQLAALGVPNVFYEVQDTLGPFRHRRTSVRVLQAALRALGF